MDNMVNLVKNMSFHEVNAATDIDQQAEEESRIHQWRSMALNHEETGPLNGNRDTTSLLGDQTWSKRENRLMRIKWMMASLEKKKKARWKR